MTTREEALEGVKAPDARGYLVDNFPVYIDPWHVARFLARYELFKLIANVPGLVIECGVNKGFGLFSWLQFNRLLEPHHHYRQIVGFDTFEGFPSVSAKDGPGHEVGDQNTVVTVEHLTTWARVQQTNWGVVARDGYELPGTYQPMMQIPRVQLVKGDFMETCDEYMERMPHVVCALLYLDFDLYEPTKRAIELFVPRMPRGAVIAFDELNHYLWPGETIAVLETLGLNRLRLKRIPFEPSMSYAVLE